MNSATFRKRLGRLEAVRGALANGEVPPGCPGKDMREGLRERLNAIRDPAGESPESGRGLAPAVTVKSVLASLRERIQAAAKEPGYLESRKTLKRWCAGKGCPNVRACHSGR